MSLLLLGGFFWLGFSFMLGLTAAGFNRSGILFFVISLVISPVLAGLLLLVLGKKQTGRQHKVRIRCPECGETAAETAQFCPSCGSEFPEVLTSPKESKEAPNSASVDHSGGLSQRNLSAIGILATTAVMVLFVSSGVYAAIQLTPYVEIELGSLAAYFIFGGLVLGGGATYAVKRIFPEQMTTM